jgi:hypothetical protein
MNGEKDDDYLEDFDQRFFVYSLVVFVVFVVIGLLFTIFNGVV